MTTFTHYNANYTQRSKDSIKLAEITDCTTQLVGTAKQVAWAKQIRQQLFISIEVCANTQTHTGSTFGALRLVQRALYYETSAQFFLSNRTKRLSWFESHYAKNPNEYPIDRFGPIGAAEVRKWLNENP